MADNDLIRRGDALALKRYDPVIKGVREDWAGMDADEDGDWVSVEAIAAIPAVTATRVKPLVWDVDGRRLHMDQTMAFSKSYDWGGWDCFRQEGYGLGASYIIWPDSIGSARWNLYGTIDGLFVPDLNGEDAAKAAAQADYERRIIAALTPAQPAPNAPDLLSIVERFVALPSGAWHPERHAAEEAELMRDARAILALRKGPDHE